MRVVSFSGKGPAAGSIAIGAAGIGAGRRIEGGPSACTTVGTIGMGAPIVAPVMIIIPGTTPIGVVVHVMMVMFVMILRQLMADPDAQAKHHHTGGYVIARVP
jgi:hypothetical protein